MKKVLSALFVLGLLAFGAQFLFQSPANAGAKEGKGEEATKEVAEQKEEKKVVYTVSLASVASMRLADSIQSSATLRAERSVDIFTKVAGQVTALNVEEGQSVEKGSVLVSLDGGDARLELEKAKVNLAKAKSEFERVEHSYKKDLVSAEEYDTKKFALKDLQAAYDLAAFKVSQTEVVAPFSGTITERAVELGQTVQPSQKLFVLASLDPLEAEVFLPENQVAALSVGQSVAFSRENGEGEPFTGKVRRISPVVDSATGTVKITVAIPSVPQDVRPGSYAQVRITTREVDEPAVLPKKALVYDNFQNASIFTVEESDEPGVFTTKRVEVKTGLEDRGYIAIQDGVKPGDLVVLTGKESLKNGSLVKGPSTQVTKN